MRKFFVFFLSVFWMGILLNGADLFSRDAYGRILTSGIRFQLTHAAPGWKTTVQNDASVQFLGEGGAFIAGEGLRREGTFAVNGGVFQLSEIVGLEKDRLKLKYHLTSERGIKTLRLALRASLNVSRQLIAPPLWNQEPLVFPAESDPDKFYIQKPWGKDNELVIHLPAGRLVISGAFGLFYQDGRKFKRQSFSLNLLFRPSAGNVKKADLELTMRYEPARSLPVDLKSVMNRGFRDAVPEDGKGGWTDQGPENDLAALQPGNYTFAGIPFLVVDPAKNGGNSCIGMKGRERPSFLNEATVAIPGYRGRFLYLLNALAWGKRSGPCGEVILRYQDGTEQKQTLVAGMDLSDFWNPIPCKRAALGWREKNRSAVIGLYVTRIPLRGQPLRELTFVSRNRVWMIVAATLSDREISITEERPYSVTPGKEWLEYHAPLEIQPGSIVDLSDLQDAPAGKHGFLRRKGSHFEWEGQPGKPVRFWGVNLCFAACFPTHADADRLVNLLAAMGCNIIRLHHFDNILGRSADEPTTVKLNPTMADRLDYLLYAAKRKGICITLDLYTGRCIKRGELKKFNSLRPNEYKTLYFIDEEVRNNLDAFVEALLNHVNPYTKTAWGREPAIAMLSLINEDNLSVKVNQSARIKQIFLKKFAEACEKNGIPITEANRENLFREYLAERYQEGYRHLSGLVKKLGVRIPLTDQNYNNDFDLQIMRRKYDYVDQHFYSGHPTYLGNRDGWGTMPLAVYMSNALSSNAGVGQLFPTRLAGMPFSCTEWNFCSPNPYAVQGPFLVGAYSAFQDYDMLCQFALCSKFDSSAPDLSMQSFKMLGDSQYQLAMRAGALFFLRRDVASAPEKIPFLIHSDFRGIAGHTIAYPSVMPMLGLLTGTGTVFEDTRLTADVAAVLTSGNVPALQKKGIPITGNYQNDLKNLTAQGRIPAGNYDFATGRFTSSTGELEIVKNTKLFRVQTGRSEACVLEKRRNWAGAFARVANGESFAAFFFTSRDGRPLTESGRILILHLTSSMGKNITFRDKSMTVLNNWGENAMLLRRNRAEISFAPKGSGKLFACSLSGKRLSEVPFRKAGNRITFTAENDFAGEPICIYEWSAE